MTRYRFKKTPREWDPDLAYVVGIIATDGNLSRDMRHINITSKDRQLIFLLRQLLRLNCKVGMKGNGNSAVKKYYVLQFGDVQFYDFLFSIGLTPRKSKSMGELMIPRQYFADFLRGCIDGDGSIGGFFHPESSQFQFRLRLTSASPAFLNWILSEVRKTMKIDGGSICTFRNSSVSVLSFAKADTIKILSCMYYKEPIPSLKRKERVARSFLRGE